MKFFKSRAIIRALSLVEVLIVILLISTSLLMAIRLFPSIFLLNRKTDDMVKAKNLADDLIQALKSEVDTKRVLIDPVKLTSQTGDPYYVGTTVVINNLVNPYKCFWSLVYQTQSGIYDPAGLDTLISDTQFGISGATGRNPSKYEPTGDPNSMTDWVAKRQFWVTWRNNVARQLPPNSPTAPDRASAIIRANYVYLDPNTNIFKDALVDDNNNNFTQLVETITPLPSTKAAKYMAQITVSLYWRDRTAKGTYVRDPAVPQYKISTLITPPLNKAIVF